MLREGGVLFLVARLIHHFVGPYDGERISHVHAMHENLSNLENAVQPSAMKLERKRKRQAMEPTDGLDNSRGYVLCPFCQQRLNKEKGLLCHLARWRKDSPFPEDEHHKIDEIRAYASERGWKPYKGKPKPKQKPQLQNRMSTLPENEQPPGEDTANIAEATACHSSSETPTMVIDPEATEDEDVE